MAITNLGTRVSVQKVKLPDNFTVVPVVGFTDEKYKTVKLRLTVVKSTVENATHATTMTNLLAAITSQIDVLLAEDYVATNTVEAFSNLIDISNNLVNPDGDGDWMSNVVPFYICNVDLFIKIS